MKKHDRVHALIGWDATEISAYNVAQYSLLRHSSIDLPTQPIMDEPLRARGLYWREPDPLASTTFAYTRFLTPALSGDCDLAIYFDCDFLWLRDISELINTIDRDKAVSVVKHNYTPPETTKMGGRVQSVYPRKNWSSLMVFNLNHPKVRALTPDVVNTATPQYLHRFGWVDDDDIGSIPFEWNWLEGWYSESKTGTTPAAVHYTRGGPWFPECQDVEYADIWRAEHQRMIRGEQ
jgi:lipopolysaccharide biosynthesis glycosyltransferase